MPNVIGGTTWTWRGRHPCLDCWHCEDSPRDEEVPFCTIRQKKMDAIGGATCTGKVKKS